MKCREDTLGADAAVLPAAERHFKGSEEACTVDNRAAGFHRRYNLEGTLLVSGEYAAGQTEDGVVRDLDGLFIGIKADDGDDRSEDFHILGDIRGLWNICDDGRLIVCAVSLAAEQKLAALLDVYKRQALTLADAYEQSVYQELLISVLRMQYERDPNQSKEAYLHYEKAANASRYLDLTPRSMTAASQHILTHADIRELIQRRVDNFNFLEEKLKAIPEIKVLSKPIGTDGNFVPFGMTILVEKREELYQYLTAHNVIPEIQWILPAEYYEPGQDAVFLSKHNLMLQCDQRYTREDMDYVENLLSAFFHHAPDLDQ